MDGWMEVGMDASMHTHTYKHTHAHARTRTHTDTHSLAFSHKQVQPEALGLRSFAPKIAQVPAASA